MRSERTLSLWCPHWPVVCLGRGVDTVAAVVSSERCIAVTPAARAHGITVGLRRREAQSRFPAVELHERDETLEGRCFEIVLAELEAVTARLEVTAAGSAAFLTRGPSRLHGGDRAMAELVLTRVSAALVEHLGDGAAMWPIGVGIADGPAAASIVAREAARQRPTAEGGAAPPVPPKAPPVPPTVPPVVVPAGATAQFLARLPIERLQHARGEHQPDVVEMTAVLRRLGLRTIGRFAALSTADVQARFGALGGRLHRLAHGEETSGPREKAPEADLRVSLAVDPPAENLDRVAFLAKGLADSLQAELSARGVACTALSVVAETDAGDRIERRWRQDSALDAAAVAQRIRWQLEGWLGTGRTRRRCSGGVDRIELIPEQVAADTGVQQGLWGGPGAATRRAIGALVRVQSLMGHDAVTLPEPLGGRSPSEQFQLVPLDGVDLTDKAAPSPAPWPGRVPSPSPSRVWSTPREVEVVDAAGARVGVSGRGLISAAPHRCHLDRRGWSLVRAWAGPWCVDERWWDAIAHRRRARLQVLLADDEPGRTHPSTGEAHLLVLEDGRWWLEASYD